MSRVEKKLSELTAGAVFIAGNKQFVVLEHSEEQTLIISNEPTKEMNFDPDSPDWSKSELRKYLSTTVFEEFTGYFGAENIVETETDLLALDGSHEYENCQDKVRVLTFDERRKFQGTYQESKEWEWLVTPWSTTERGWKYSVCCVSGDGGINGNGCHGDYVWVRPVCILKSNIFVSAEE